VPQDDPETTSWIPACPGMSDMKGNVAPLLSAAFPTAARLHPAAAS
jgi:hypothetical protein